MSLPLKPGFFSRLLTGENRPNVVTTIRFGTGSRPFTQFGDCHFLELEEWEA